MKQPTVKQMQSVSCPACNAPVGTPCTLQGGHRARADAYRVSAGVPAQQTPTDKATRAQKPRPGARSCAICHKPLCKRPTAKAKSGKTCHASCLKQAQQAGTGGGNPPASQHWNTAAAEREFARNKEAVESGRTYRGHKPTEWRLGSSPSTAGEARR
ncbi:zinc finger domain-containing protein [Streptomyces sp. NPDC001635]